MYDGIVIKFLPIIAIILVVGGFIAFRGSLIKTSPTTVSEPQPVPDVPPSLFSDTSNSSTDDRLKTLEGAVAALLKQTGGVSSTQPTGQPLGDSARVKLLETEVADLQQRLLQLQSTGSIQATASPHVPVYIPLGDSGSTNDNIGTDWFLADGFEANINPTDYPGYTSMQLEVSMRVVSSLSGVGYARVYNYTDGSSIASSDVSTSADKYSLVTSSGFKLPAGKKSYRLQIKSVAYDAFISNARIRVNF